MLPYGDIRTVEMRSIPDHDILCAGFPCQPFSKAGYQNGIWDPIGGTLFRDIVNIVRERRPEYLILENVPNLERHNNGKTWSTIRAAIEAEGYDLDTRRYSPHQFGIPQIRDRLYIVGRWEGLGGFNWPDSPDPKPELSVYSVLDTNPTDAHPIPDQVKQCVQVWQNFLDEFPQDSKLPSFPIWSMEFGATYPYEHKTPHSSRVKDLRQTAGSHGQPLVGWTRQQIYEGYRATPGQRTRHSPSGKSSSSDRIANCMRSIRRGSIDGCQRSVTSRPASRNLSGTAKGRSESFVDTCCKLGRRGYVSSDLRPPHL